MTDSADRLSSLLTALRDEWLEYQVFSNDRLRDARVDHDDIEASSRDAEARTLNVCITDLAPLILHAEALEHQLTETAKDWVAAEARCESLEAETALLKQQLKWAEMNIPGDPSE